MKPIFIRILLVGALIGSLTMTAPVTSFASTLPPPVDSVPVEVTTNSTSLLFYFYGILDAMDAADAGMVVPLRLAASSNREMAFQFRAASPVMFSYLMGRAAQFDREADLRGEPAL
jgi:hypothetical protein